MLCGMWDLPGPGLEPESPALAGRFLTTEPPVKSLPILFDLNVAVVSSDSTTILKRGSKKHVGKAKTFAEMA